MNGQPQEYEIAAQLEEIKDEIKELLGNAQRLLRGENYIWERARRYWYGHIVSALDREHGYMGSSMVTMQDTIDELMGRNTDEEEEGGGPGLRGSVSSMRLTNTYTRLNF